MDLLPVTPMRDIRLEIKFRNNLILRRVEDAGYRSLMQICKKNRINYSNLAAFLGLGVSSPRTFCRNRVGSGGRLPRRWAVSAS